MPLMPLALPPGVLSNGTELQSSGRWRDASLVRWAQGTMQPVGGWSARVSVTATPPRAATAWEDLAGDRWLAVASFDKIEVVNAAGTVTDITPAGLTAGDASAGLNTGFGGGFFGTGYFGTVRSDPGSYGEATTWSLDTWGEELIACSVADGRIWYWDLDTANNLVVVPNAPVDNLGAMVTEERFLFALGAGGNPRNVAWSDREDRTLWTPLATNEAGDIDLQTTGQIMCGLKVPGRALILTDEDAHTATYIGPPFVYGFQRVGTSCGVLSRRAAISVDSKAFWMGYGGFFAWDGQSVVPLACTVTDRVFNDMSDAQKTKIHAIANSRFGEVWWFYPSGESTECDRYVAYNYRENHWAIGSIARSAGFDRGVFRQPIWFGVDGQAYDHETGYNYDGSEVFAETGPLQLGNGDQVMQVTGMLPDELTEGDVTATFKTRFYPNSEEREYGPYAMNAPTSMRFTGRSIKMRVSGARLGAWRVGVMRLDAVAGGGR